MICDINRLATCRCCDWWLSTPRGHPVYLAHRAVTSASVNHVQNNNPHLWMGCIRDDTPGAQTFTVQSPIGATIHLTRGDIVDLHQSPVMTRPRSNLQQLQSPMQPTPLQRCTHMGSAITKWPHNGPDRTRTAMHDQLSGSAPLAPERMWVLMCNQWPTHHSLRSRKITVHPHHEGTVPTHHCMLPISG